MWAAWRGVGPGGHGFHLHRAAFRLALVSAPRRPSAVLSNCLSNWKNLSGLPPGPQLLIRLNVAISGGEGSPRALGSRHCAPAAQAPAAPSFTRTAAGLCCAVCSFGTFRDACAGSPCTRSPRTICLEQSLSSQLWPRGTAAVGPWLGAAPASHLAPVPSGQHSGRCGRLVPGVRVSAPVPCAVRFPSSGCWGRRGHLAKGWASHLVPRLAVVLLNSDLK